ncbi:MAG: hypothetical protein ABFS42_03900 [Candidatus Krumholzibacteriota bacterium]
MNPGNNQTRVMAVFLVVGFILTPMICLANSAPVVSNVFAVQRDGTFIVDITYDLVDPDGDLMWVSLYFSPDGGATWPIVCRSVTGDVGAFVASGTGRSVEWNSRDDFPNLISTTCTIRVVANDESPYPYFDSVWKSDLGGANEIPFAIGDTLAFGHPFRLRWHGTAPSIEGMDPLLLASLDTIPPHDDGLLGFKYRFPGENCIPVLEDCWNPRKFDPSTGDSVSYFAPVSLFDFYNDDSGSDPFHRLLPSGLFEIHWNALDVMGLEVLEPEQAFNFVVNFDPETIMLDGETDWAHPEDPEVYPYYILLNDPAQIHHPFMSGDRIPDRTYVVVKALGRDDARDLKLDPSFEVGLSGYVKGVRSNLGGGLFSFQSETSILNPVPTWPANPEGWSADTLGFLTGPNTEFTMHMQAVDEHGRKDGTPATIDFHVGYPPCIQCIEILPSASTPSEFDETLACLADTSAATIGAHPCFGDTTVLRAVNSPTGAPDELQNVGPAFMLVDKTTGFTQIVLDPGQGGDLNYEIDVQLFQMGVLLHGLDDIRERWIAMDRRQMGCMYQVDYDCDPFNQIQDGGGNDDIRQPTWGESPGRSGLVIDPATGLWRISVDVAVPTALMTMGPQNYKDVYLQFVKLIEDPEAREMVFDATTKQFGLGLVRAIALDQTQCSFLPPRPAKYNFFRHVRPTVATPPAGKTWRDCDLTYLVPGIMLDMDISPGAMPSLDGVPAPRYFRITVETLTGDFECSMP